MGMRVAKSLVSPNMLDMMALADGYQLAEITVPEPWYGHSLAQINVRRNHGISVLAIQRGGEYLVAPGADRVFQAGDVLLVLGKQENITALERL